MKERILALQAENPRITQAEVARVFKVTSQRISQVCKEHGISLRDGRADHAKPKSIAFNHAYVKGPGRIFAGASSELLAASNLLKRGHMVFRCVSPYGPFDLVADVGGQLYRIEVRSASVRVDGSLQFGGPEQGRCDVLALVTPGGDVYFKPRPGVTWQINPVPEIKSARLD